MRVFSSSAGLCVRALFVRKGIRACTKYLFEQLSSSPISPARGEIEDAKGPVETKKILDSFFFYVFGGSERLCVYVFE